MSVEFKLPDIGEGLEEGEIVKWLVSEGDTVKADQNIVQVETDKAVADLPSPASGKILKIHHKEGDVVKVGEVLVSIGESGEKVKETKTAKKQEKKEKTDEKPGETHVKTEEVPHTEAAMGEAATGKVAAAPAVRKLARNLGIDLSEVKGTGSKGQILKSDLEKANPEIKEKVEKKAEVPQQTLAVKKKYDMFGYVDRVPLKGIRKTIAANMVKSLQENAQLTTMDEIDVSKLWRLREKEKKHFAIQGFKLTFLPFIVKACIGALKENPLLNSSIEGEEIIVKKYYNVGIAVESEAGLMVPVVKIAEKKSIAKIAQEIQELAEKVRSRKIDVMDMKGGTFTITNYGSVGGTYATPVINPPEAAILGLGRIYDKVVPDKKKGFKVIKSLPISLTFDHRVIDGAQAGRFVESLKIFLEDPDHLFMEIHD